MKLGGSVFHEDKKQASEGARDMIHCRRVTLDIGKEVLDREVCFQQQMAGRRIRPSELRLVRRIILNTAYHEAGHVLAYAALYPSGTILRARIDDDAGCLGHVRVRADFLQAPNRISSHGPGRRHATALRQAGIALYAGVAAEFVDVELSRMDPTAAARRKHEREIWDSSGNDRERFGEFAAMLGENRAAERWHQPSWTRAQALVRRNWRAVEQVAKALAMFGELSGPHCEYLVGRHLSTTTRDELSRPPRWLIHQQRHGGSLERSKRVTQ